MKISEAEDASNGAAAEKLLGIASQPWQQSK
jgi:hypothetical protein